MTPSERERRIEAAQKAWFETRVMSSSRQAAEHILDAADEAVPVVSEAQVIANVGAEALIEEVWKQRAERAEAAARDFAEALAEIAERPRGQGGGSRSQRAADALARHPSFSGEEGTDV